MACSSRLIVWGGDVNAELLKAPLAQIDEPPAHDAHGWPGLAHSRSSRGLASLVAADAFVGELTRGSIGTIRATVETENTRSYQGGVWLTSQSAANRSPVLNSLLNR